MSRIVNTNKINPFNNFSITIIFNSLFYIKTYGITDKNLKRISAGLRECKFETFMGIYTL